MKFSAPRASYTNRAGEAEIEFAGGDPADHLLVSIRGEVSNLVDDLDLDVAVRQLRHPLHEVLDLGREVQITVHGSHLQHHGLTGAARPCRRFAPSLVPSLVQAPTTMATATATIVDPAFPRIRCILLTPCLDGRWRR